MPVQNALGATGANLADILKQTVGWMSVLIIFALCGWAWRLILRDESMRVTWRVIALLVTLVLVLKVNGLVLLWQGSRKTRV